MFSVFGDRHGLGLGLFLHSLLLHDVDVLQDVAGIKAMKSSPLLGPFCGSKFWGFSLLKI